jgi:mRNA interferase RelE/StbE
MAIKYILFIEPEVHAARRSLPGHIRQRVHRLISDFADNPPPVNSRLLITSSLALPQGIEIHRVRLEQWRIVYAIHDAEAWVWVLAIQRRPPYDDADLPDLVKKLSN